VTLLAALMHEREREITDPLVELLISTVHRIGARAKKKVTEQRRRQLPQLQRRLLDTSVPGGL
jgi:hypothetical protein